MLGGGDGISPGSVHDDDPSACGGIHIDIVHTHTGATDDFEICGGFEDGCRHFGLAADDKRGELGDDLDDFRFRQAGFDDNLEGAADGEFIDTTLRHRIGDENFGSGKGHFLFFRNDGL
jgi:hypothetical protein